jgi:hypothetical protein
MEVKYRIYEVLTKSVLKEYESGYGRTSTTEEEITVLEPHYEYPKTFATAELAVAALGAGESGGTFTVLPVYTK